MPLPANRRPFEGFFAAKMFQGSSWATGRRSRPARKYSCFPVAICRGQHCQLGSLVTNLQAQRRCKPPIVIPCRSEPERLIRWLTTSETEPTPYELGRARVTARAGSGQAVRSRRQTRAAFWVQKKAA